MLSGGYRELALLHAEGLQQCLSRAAALVDHIEPDRHLRVEALALACHLDPPVYDCLYLALARREAAVLLTAHPKPMAPLKGAAAQGESHG